MQDSIYINPFLVQGKYIHIYSESLKHLFILRNRKSRYEKEKGSQHLLEMLVQRRSSPPAPWRPLCAACGTACGSFSVAEPGSLLTGIRQCFQGAGRSC